MELRYLDEASANRILNTALDCGINYIDTSPEYPMAEYFIGKSLEHRRDGICSCYQNAVIICPAWVLLTFLNAETIRRQFGRKSFV